MFFEVIGKLGEVETIAQAGSIRELDRLVKTYGKGRWRKRKGIGTIRLLSGELQRAEIHWYEAHGIGKKELKIKKILD